MLSFVLLFAVEVYDIVVYRIYASLVLKNKKVKRRTELLIWCALFVIGNLLTYFIIKDAWYNSIIMWILFLATLKILYVAKFSKLCLTCGFMVIAGILSEFITVYSWMLFTGQGWMSVKNDGNSVGLILISKVMLFLIVKLFIAFDRMRNNVEISFQDWLEIFLVPIGSSIVLYALFCNKENMDNPLNVMAVCAILVINVFTYHLYEKTKIVTEQRIRGQMLKEESLYYIRQYNDNEKIWNELRKFRHNIKEQYITQKIMLKNKEYEKLDKMYDEVLHMSSSKVNASNIGNIYFDSIINYKAVIAESFGIKIKLDAIIPTNASVDVEDINLCLGNLLDNAIEALKTFDGERVIDLVLKSEQGNLWISVSNGCANNPVKQDGKYITTKNESIWHGLGLSIVKDIVDKYDGDMKIDETDGKFMVNILMYEFLI